METPVRSVPAADGGAQLEVLLLVAPAALVAAVAMAIGGLLLATADPAQREAFWPWLSDRLALVAMAWLVLTLAGAWVCRRLWQQHVRAARRLAGELRTAQARPEMTRLPGGAADASAALRLLAQGIDGLLARHAALHADVERRVGDASRDVEQERARLAALMSELQQSVVVCTLDGRVLLFNARARLQFRALSEAPALGGAQPLALGRSIHTVFDRRLVAHALESVQQRLARGVPHPSAQFVTASRGGQLLRVRLAPVRPADPDTPAAAIAGYVLMLDNITREVADETARDRLLTRFTESSRGALGNLQAAVELLETPDLEPEVRARFQTVVREEVGALSQAVRELAAHTTQSSLLRWPLEDMLGSDLLAAAVRRIAALAGCRADADDVDPGLWLRVDSYSLTQALCFLAHRLAQDHEVRRVVLRLQAAGGRAQLDLVWFGQAMSTETAVSLETEAMRVGDEAASLTVRDVVERHSGAFWFERERVRQAAFFRFLLPLAADAPEALDPDLLGHGPSRPEFYDFDLFQVGSDQARALAERSLRDLTFTVFDTETTGLQPSAGDEIIQIGALRIVAGKLRRDDAFDQLVDPQRPLGAAGIAIHGIQPAMLQGQPRIDEVLPAFHDFVGDSVMVAHNAAFDMSFLQRKEALCGLRFDQPVLDTLLLSSILHPEQESHRLEAIAERLGVPVLGRHTALGDAMVTAEVFLLMIPLLESQGLTRLGQVMEAARRSRFARVTY